MDNFNDLDAMFEKIIKEFPQKKKELLENVGNVLEKQVKENIDSRVNTNSKKHEKEKLKQDVKKVFGSKGGYVALKPSYEHSGLNHLIENGHRIVRNGVVVGYVNGKHVYRDSIVQCEDKILELAENMVNEVVKDNG
ncbi:hypothetical protein DP124_12030 [Clostridium tetani]|uniref:hypothetical protein n=1 Tax=Clostridium tetani TaxID=1513 RepID=UPI00100AD161|nr:hypothetical protein [Clostridium tetani]RXI50191.1 hypothetical protein DP124_12030 [Clostridium tetani]